MKLYKSKSNLVYQTALHSHWMYVDHQKLTSDSSCLNYIKYNWILIDPKFKRGLVYQQLLNIENMWQDSNGNNNANNKLHGQNNSNNRWSCTNDNDNNTIDKTNTRKSSEGIWWTKVQLYHVPLRVYMIYWDGVYLHSC